jgi:hypothetical protein
LASYRFDPPVGHTHAEVLLEAHHLRVARGDYNIKEEHLADAIENMIEAGRKTLSKDRSPKDPYKKAKTSGAGAAKQRVMGKNTVRAADKAAKRKRK